MQSLVPNLVYAGQACYNCFAAPALATPAPGEQRKKLALCSGCRRIKYCSSTCAAAAWKDHKPFCKAFPVLRKMAGVVPAPPPSQSDEIAELRHAARSTYMLESELLSTALGREPSLAESRLVYRELRCTVCWRLETPETSWSMCGGCRLVGYCSEAHRLQGSTEHLAPGRDGRSVCQAYILSSEIDEFYLRLSLASSSGKSPTSTLPSWTPARILPTAEPLPSSWEKYLETTQLPPGRSNAEVYGVFVEALSPVLTILEGSRRLGFGLDWGGQEKLVIHIVGATVEVEGAAGLQAYEELLHQLPKLKKLELVFVGDEVPDEIESYPLTHAGLLCPTCTAAGRERTAVWRKGAYHSLVTELPKADLIVAFNAGFSHLPVLVSPWTPTLVHIIGNSLPFVWTAQTVAEALEDQKRIEELDGGSRGQRVEWAATGNRWGGAWMRVDVWEQEGGWRNNAWWGGLAGVGAILEEVGEQPSV